MRDRHKWSGGGGGEGGGGVGGSGGRWAAESCALYRAAATSAAPPAGSQQARGQEGGTRPARPSHPGSPRRPRFMNRKFPRQRRRLRDAEREPEGRVDRGTLSTEGTGAEEISPAAGGAAARRATSSPSRTVQRKEPRKYG